MIVHSCYNARRQSKRQILDSFLAQYVLTAHLVRISSREPPTATNRPIDTETVPLEAELEAKQLPNESAINMWAELRGLFAAVDFDVPQRSKKSYAEEEYSGDMIKTADIIGELWMFKYPCSRDFDNSHRKAIPSIRKWDSHHGSLGRRGKDVEARMLGSNHLVSATYLAATLTTPPPPAASPFFARNRVILTSSGMNSNFDDEFFIDEI